MKDAKLADRTGLIQPIQEAYAQTDFRSSRQSRLLPYGAGSRPRDAFRLRWHAVGEDDSNLRIDLPAELRQDLKNGQSRFL